MTLARLGRVAKEIPRVLTLGDLIRHQRELAALSIRQLAEVVGISIPYLSQIERDLREPSERVLQAIARSLNMSADALMQTTAVPRTSNVLSAVGDDPDLTTRQRAVLAEIYLTFRDLTRERRISPTRSRRQRSARPPTDQDPEQA